VNVLIRIRSSILVSDKEKSVLQQQFPWLFPFGHGGLVMVGNEKRKTSISEEECFKHYLKLRSRSFAQD